MLDDGKTLTGELSNFWYIEDVPGDGNFGYYSIYVGLQEMNKIDSLESTEVSYLRTTFWNHAKNSFDILKNNEVYQFCSDDPEKRKKGWNRELLSKIHDSKFDNKKDAPDTR